VSKSSLTVGLISDTHGLMRDEALRQLEGSDVIIHAGDVGQLTILDRLKQIAPLSVVRGNIDLGDWADSLPHDALVQVGETLIYVIHDVNDIKANLQADRVHIVVSGHTHKPEKRQQGDILYINPGSAGPRRFKLPISVARLTICGDQRDVEFVDLAVSTDL
jgi:uncharacterized protein